MVDDVDDAIAFYTNHFGFTLGSNMAPAFADVVRGPLRILLSGPKSSAARPMPDGRKPGPGGWNRIHFIVDDIEAEVARLRGGGVRIHRDPLVHPRSRRSAPVHIQRRAMAVTDKIGAAVRWNRTTTNSARG